MGEYDTLSLDELYDKFQEDHMKFYELLNREDFDIEEDRGAFISRTYLLSETIKEITDRFPEANLDEFLSDMVRIKFMLLHKKIEDTRNLFEGVLSQAGLWEDSIDYQAGLLEYVPDPDKLMHELPVNCYYAQDISGVDYIPIIAEHWPNYSKETKKAVIKEFKNRKMKADAKALKKLG
jgi:hypothetical protein